MNESLVDEFTRFAKCPFDEQGEFFDRLRANEPLFKTSEGFWYVTSYEVACELLSNDGRLTNNPTSAVSTAVPDWVRHGGAASRIFQKSIVFMDGAEHARLRGLVRKPFSPKSIARYEPRVAKAADALIDRAISQGGEGDFLALFAARLPTTVILELVGLPASELDRFHRLAYHFLAKHFPASISEWAASADPDVEDAARLIIAAADERRSSPQDDLLTALAQSNDDGDTLSDDELVAMVIFLVIAGYETTANTLTNGVFELLSRPERWERLKREPELIETAVEEILRYQGSVRNGSPKYATTDIEINGVTISEGDRIYIGLNASNRDPNKFDNPNDFDLSRTPNRHLEFSQGAHFCLGHALARLEMMVALEALMRRTPEIELVTTDVSWKNHFHIRGFDSLMVRWNAGP